MKKNPYIPPGFFSELQSRGLQQSGTARVPKVSVVMPSYNQASFIETSILSVLNQGYDNVQLIVIDGGSTDGTLDIIKKYNHSIDYWVSEPDDGQSDALNKGFAVANGEIFGWLNADDVYFPGALQQAVQSLKENPDKQICFGDWVSINEKNAIFARHPAFDFRLGHLLYEGFPLNAQAMFWKSQVHGRFSGFWTDLRYTMDYQMMVEFGINEGDDTFLRIPRILGGFRRHEAQKTAGYTPEVHAEHLKIASGYGCSDKYAFRGKVKRMGYRLRRGWWYFRREGLSQVVRRLMRRHG